MVVRAPAVIRRNPFTEDEDPILAKRFPGRNRALEIVNIVLEEGYADLAPTAPLIDGARLYRAGAEAAARILHANPSAKVAKPATADETKQLRREVADKVARYRELGTVPKVDTDARRKVFQVAGRSGEPVARDAAWWAWLAALVARENAERERQQLAEELGHSVPLGYRKQLAPGDPLTPYIIGGLPDYSAELAFAMTVVPSASAKGGR